MNSTLPVPKMVVPSERRPGVRGMLYGIMQIQVTRACDLACHGCSAGSQLISRPAVMTPEQFEQAVVSMEGYFGVIALFGGNPCTSRYFPDYCRILKTHVPWTRRGIWTNRLFGHGKLCAQTFDPSHSNINVHCSDEAFAEFQRDWPDAITARAAHTNAGHTTDSIHASPYISMKDLDSLTFPDGTVHENTEANRWKLIGACPINRHWSAIITLVGGELRAFACEIQGHMAALHHDNPNWDETGQPPPNVGLPVERGWWKRPQADFNEQFRTFCHNCSVPLNRPGQKAIGGEREEFSERHRHIARPKTKGREVVFINSEQLGARSRPSTEYLDGTTPRTHRG